MATEAALTNKRSDEVEFGEIAKKYSGCSRNSSRFSKCKQKRVSDKSCSESDDDHDKICTPLIRRLSRKENPPSDYSSSEEGERDPNQVTTSKKISDNELDNRRVLRKRRNHTREIPAEEGTSKDQHVSPSSSPNGWELIGEGLKYSDLSLTGSDESSDDFWKSNSQTKLTEKDSKSRGKSKAKKEKSVTVSRLRRFFQWRLNVSGVVKRNWRSEWKSFKADHQEDWRKLKQQYYTCSIGLMIVFIFCGIGGIIFHSTEGAFEMYYKCGVKRVKRDFLDVLYLKRWLSEDEWKSLARTKLMDFENQLYDAYDAGMTSYSGQKGWSFVNSFMYSLTVVTTIGYGHLAPVTTAGRIITIVYAVFGIPLFLILLADYGKLLTRGIKFVWAYVRRVYYTGSCRKVRKTAPVQEVVKGVQLVLDNVNKVRKSSTAKPEEAPVFPRPASPLDTPAMSTYTIDDNFNLPISVAFAILILYIIGGAFLFSTIEKWNFFEAFYFVFISTSTIGLGDYVPSGEVWVLLWSLVYFVFGLALTTMCINVVTEKLTDSFRAATAKIGATMGLELAEEGVDIDSKEQDDPAS